jgi:hypothetical protein
MEFSVKWAAASAVYAVMIFGVAMMVGKPHGPGVASFPLGLFFGSAMGLPLAATNLIAALATAWLLRDLPFGVQFAGFAIGGLALYWLLLLWLDKATRTMGGIIHGPDGEARYLLFFGASLIVSLICMGLASRTAPA